MAADACPGLQNAACVKLLVLMPVFGMPAGSAGAGADLHELRWTHECGVAEGCATQQGQEGFALHNNVYLGINRHTKGAPAIMPCRSLAVQILAHTYVVYWVCWAALRA